MAYSEEFRRRAVGLVLSGATAAEAALEAGCSASALGGWLRSAGVAARRGRIGGAMARAVPSPGASYRRLGLEDRVLIADWASRGVGVRESARRLGVSHSTVSRELARHGGAAGYRARAAQAAAEAAARRPRPSVLAPGTALRAEVVRRLGLRFSPEQASSTIARDFPGEEGMRVSHETICRALYVQGRGSLREELACEWALRSGRASRKPRSRLPERRGRKRWVEGAELALRPPEADDRRVPGHWEGDLVVGTDGASCLVTLVERSSRFLLCSRLCSHDAETVADRLREMVAGLPASLSRTLTWDRGVEMARWRSFAEATGFDVFFCDPRSPWQRGTNENTNGLLREFFPKGTDFREATDDVVREAQDLLNGRPRKTLGWRTPAEVLAEELDRDGGALAV